MGFFGSLFEKRQCSICGKEMGLTERKELSGGNLCDEPEIYGFQRQQSAG